MSKVGGLKKKDKKGRVGHIAGLSIEVGFKPSASSAHYARGLLEVLKVNQPLSREQPTSYRLLQFTPHLSELIF